MEDLLKPLIGGMIIGLATTVMLIFNGRISGISGILGNILVGLKREHNWRYSFIVGLVIGGIIMLLLFPSYFQYTIQFSYLEAVIAGGFVGFGTQLGSGCTSGHGVCGLPRLSVRSLVATMTFMAFGIITVLVRGLA